MIPAPQPNGAGDSFTSTNYWQRLHPWCIVRFLPQMQRIVIQRFRYRSQAEEYLRVLKRLLPHANHQIIFDPAPESFTPFEH
ncbi:hypothetical protein [Phormidesmis priestleyi]